MLLGWFCGLKLIVVCLLGKVASHTAHHTVLEGQCISSKLLFFATLSLSVLGVGATSPFLPVDTFKVATGVE